MTTGRAWNGRLLAGVRPRPSRAPHRLPACAALGRPMSRQGFDGIEVADVADPAALADDAGASTVKGCWRTLTGLLGFGERASGHGGEDPPAPDNCGGPRPGGL